MITTAHLQLEQHCRNRVLPPSDGAPGLQAAYSAEGSEMEELPSIVFKWLAPYSHC